MNNAIAITGIHTGIGKTIAAAVIAEALGADYWKPVQAGELHNSDSIIVRSFLTDGVQRVHPEAFLLTQPLSPHAAARIDGVTIDHTTFQRPATDELLLIETAGGVLSPMSEDATMADFVAYHQLPTILITNNYLGSINHTLLSIEALKHRGIQVLGIVVSGAANTTSEAYIAHYGGVPVIAHIPFLDVVNNHTIKEQAARIAASLQKHIHHGNDKGAGQ